MSWKQPGKRARVLYRAAEAIAGSIFAAIGRMGRARTPGDRQVVRTLPKGPLIVIANHTSYADGILLVLACRDLDRSLRMLATAGVFRMPLIGPVARTLGFIPVHRGSTSASASLDAAAAALAAGEAVGLFPEGRITRDPGKWPERSKTGAVRLALRSGAPIVPIALDGADKVIGDEKHLRRVLRNMALPPEVRVLVGQPIDVAALTGPDPDEAALRSAADEVMGQLVDLVEELRGLEAPHPHGVPRVEDGPLAPVD